MTPPLRDLLYCQDVLQPRALNLLAEQQECIGIPWRFFRWRRAYKAHKEVLRQWLLILDGEAQAPWWWTR